MDFLISTARKVRTLLECIKFEHSIFALPFALTGALLASESFPSLHVIFWIVVAMFGGRSGAMAMNRLIDSRYDRINPRTKNWPFSSGLISKYELFVFALLSFGLLVFASYMLNPLCFYLSPVAIFLLVFYSYTKRFTSLSHIFLGLCWAMAPMGAWIAIRGEFSWRIVPLCFASLFMVAGFDIIYALQDVEFDRSVGLYSIPAKFGVDFSLMVSRLFHIFTWLLLLYIFFSFKLGALYLVGILIVGILFLVEHIIIWGGDLSRIDIAFFHVNATIGIMILLFTMADLLIRRAWGF
ncbi:MAG: UbiA-like polyprenyltransferase [Candidatus Aenigmatarchaeota archaeon]